MVVFEKRYQGISSDLVFVDFRRLLNIFDIQTKEEFVFGLFQTWNAVWDIENLFWRCFKSGIEV